MVRAYAYIPWVKDQDEGEVAAVTVAKSAIGQELPSETNIFQSIIEDDADDDELFE